MNTESIVYVLKAMDVQTAKQNGEWVQCACPLAPWTHAGGVDRHPSFGVKEAKGISGVNCFSCGFKGGVLSLVRTYGRHAIESGLWTPDDMKQLEDYVILAEDEDDVVAHVGTFDRTAVVEEELRKCLGVQHPYFEERGLSEDAVKRWGLGYVEHYVDERGEFPSTMRKRVLFPVYERVGARLELRGIVGRTTVDEDPKYKNAPPNFKKTQYLYGLWHQEKQRRLVVVEGPMDCVTLNEGFVQAGIDGEFLAVALLGMTPNHAQTLLLLDHADEVVCMLDNDPSGKLGTKDLIDELDKHLLVSVVEWPEDVKDPDEAGDLAVDLVLNRVSVLEHKLRRALS